MYTNINRKDCSPIETINKVITILNNRGIKIKETDLIKTDKGWVSIRLELEGLNGIGVNGKGISYEYALASAYGELLERLWTQNLLSKDYKYFYKKAKEISGEQLTMQEKYLFLDVMNSTNEQSNVELIDKLMSVNEYCNIGREFKNLVDGMVIKMPINLVNFMCGTNGLCAGNSMEEAVSQGICELFERHVQKLIHFERIILNDIDKSVFKDYHSGKLLKQLDNMGVQYIIKDCTLGGVFPVIGMIVLNKDRTKHLYALGSDVDINIALQRCITEIFQGKDINNDIVKRMNPIRYGDIIIDKNDQINKAEEEIEFIRSISQSSGKLPISCFNSYGESDNFLNAFTNIKNNKEALSYLLNIAKNNKLKVFISDYSKDDFYAYRVYIPGISEPQEINAVNYMLLRNENSIIQRLQYITSENVDLNELLKVFELAKKNSFLKVYGYIKNILKVNLDNEYEYSYFDDDLIIGLINFSLGNDKVALNHFKIFLLKTNKYEFKLRNTISNLYYILNNKLNNWELGKTLKTISFNFTNDDISYYNNIFINRKDSLLLIEVPMCPKCENCSFSKTCNIEIHKSLINKCI